MRSYTQRTSALILFFQDEKMSIRLIFLGYWQLKRQITDVIAHVTTYYFAKHSSSLIGGDHGF